MRSAMFHFWFGYFNRHNVESFDLGLQTYKTYILLKFSPSSFTQANGFAFIHIFLVYDSISDLLCFMLLFLPTYFWLSSLSFDTFFICSFSYLTIINNMNILYLIVYVIATNILVLICYVVHWWCIHCLFIFFRYIIMIIMLYLLFIVFFRMSS